MAKKGILLLGILLVLAGIAASFLGKTWKAGDRWTAPAGANGFRSDEYLVWSNNDRLIA